MSKKWIAPSILSADFAELGVEIQRVEEAGAHLLHIDVMDGHFVPNLTIGMPVVKSIKPKSKIPLDVHLMIDKPERFVEEFIQSGADYLTIHVEASEDVEGCLKKIKSKNCKVGITLRPGTPLQSIEKYLPLVDLVLVMSVEPGFGGQSFRAEQLEKVKALVQLRKNQSTHFLIEIDGGVNVETAQLCWQAGCDILVAGSAVFKGEKTVVNYKKNIESLL